MDVLSDWLREGNAPGLRLVRTRFAAPWGIAIPSSPEDLFHVVTEGTCWLRRAGHPALLELRRGDYVLLPGGEANELLDAAGSPTPSPCPWSVRSPRLVHFSAEDLREQSSLAAVMELLCQEVERPGPGTEALLPSLFGALLLDTLRARGKRQCASPGGWMAALQDPAEAKGLERMHAEPGRPWTVESLAQAVGLSRAAFAKRFAEVLGEGPVTYLAGWRMRLAARRLTGGRESLSELASQLGYDSEFAFSRAFKRQTGQSPSAYRKQRRPGRAAAS